MTLSDLRSIFADVQTYAWCWGNMTIGLSNRNFGTVMGMNAILITLSILLVVVAYLEISRAPLRNAKEIAASVFAEPGELPDHGSPLEGSFDESGSIQIAQSYAQTLAQLRDKAVDGDLVFYIDHPLFAGLSAGANRFRSEALRRLRAGETDTAESVRDIDGIRTYLVAAPLRAVRDCRRCDEAGLTSFSQGDIIGLREMAIPIGDQIGLSGKKLYFASAMLVCVLLVLIGFVFPGFKRDRRERATITHRAVSYQHQAATDPLTGLYNRRYFEAALRSYLDEFNVRGKSLGLFLLDLDHFKAINDAHGHDWGDVVLKEVALRLMAITRDNDVVARIGGEEFGVIVPYINDTQLAGIAERYRDSIANLKVEIGDVTLRPTASIGVATNESRNERFGELLKTADTRLYEAKRAGRNQVAA